MTERDARVAAWHQEVLEVERVLEAENRVVGYGRGRGRSDYELYNLEAVVTTRAKLLALLARVREVSPHV